MKCTKCGAETRSKRVEHSITVSGVKVSGDLQAEGCMGCDASVLDLHELARFELLVAAALATHGVCTGESFRFVRKALGMRAADVGTVLGVTPETVSRWETGQRDVDRHVFAMLG